MINISIKEKASNQNLPTLRGILDGRNWNLKKVSITYNPSRGLPNPFLVDKWPFKAIFEIDGKEVVIWIYSLTVGYGGSGPHDLASILDFLGVAYTDEEVFTTRHMDYDGYIRLNY